MTSKKILNRLRDILTREYRNEIKKLYEIENKENLSEQNTRSKHFKVVNQFHQPVSLDDFKVLASSNSELHLKIKENLLISRD